MRGNRVDHPRKSSKDLADAVCGAIYGAISHTSKNTNLEVEVHTFNQRPKTDRENFLENVIEYKTKELPDDVRDYLSRFNML